MLTTFSSDAYKEVFKLAMPLDLYLVRHGESEGNLARARSEQGDDSVFTEEFRKRHSSALRLTDRGIGHAKAAARWFSSNVSSRLDRYLVSGYARAMETAAYLNLPDGTWYQDFYLRERDMGEFDILSEQEKQEQYPESYEAYKRDPFYWTPPNGESLAQLCLRIDRVLNTLHRECEGKKVIIVCHGMVMWAFRIRLERLTPQMYLEQSQWGNEEYRIRNCQIIHYTRKLPGEEVMARRCEWVRSICPWSNAEGFGYDWRPIIRPRFTSRQLLDEVEKSVRILA